MAKKLTTLSWADIQKAMSIAGSPEKITQLGEQIMNLVSSSIDVRNIAEINNAQFVLKRVMAELNLWEKMERQRQQL